jgi:hypothetical protein
MRCPPSENEQDVFSNQLSAQHRGKRLRKKVQRTFYIKKRLNGIAIQTKYTLHLPKPVPQTMHLMTKEGAYISGLQIDRENKQRVTFMRDGNYLYSRMESFTVPR